MPLTLGQGILPAGNIGNQLSYITRRAVLPKCVVQIWNASPTVTALLSNAELEGGGIDSVVANVQYAALTQPQWTSFQGNFTAAQVVQGVQPAAWAMTELVCPIPIFLNELLVQEKQTIQSILNLRFNDAGNAIRDALGQSLFNNTSNNLQLLGLPEAIDDGTGGTATYGGITRSGNTWWQSKRYNAGAVAPTRANLLQYILGITKQQGEAPMLGVTNFGTWGSLAQDFLGLERYLPREESGAYLSAFRAVDVAGVPIYADPYCPEGTLYLINTNYLTLRIHEAAQWEFIDFEPMTPVNQLAYVGVVLLVCCLINTKPRASGQVFNYTSLSI
jgi:hypothetical protein